MNDTSKPQIDIHMTAVVKDQLIVKYKITNNSDGPVLTYDGIPIEPEEKPTDLTGKVYVFSGGEETARLKRTRALLPKGKKLNRIRIPLVYKIEAGESREVEFQLDLPLRERSEYSPHFEDAIYKETRVTKIELVVGYFVPRDGTILTPVEEEKPVFKSSGQYGEQKFAKAAVTMPAPIELHVRMDSKFIRE